MANEVEQIKERLSIVDVISSYVKLEKAGVNLRARCPFHSEKTPSFFVSPARNSYYCFGCGAKGDIFSFVEAFEGLDFVGALKALAAKAGVSLVREDPKISDERSKLFAIMEAAVSFFESNFKVHVSAQEYLRGRGLTEATAAHFRIGYAKPEWRELLGHLRKKGFSDRLIITSGLVKEIERGAYDRFRGRIMFPIADSAGRVVAFSGRFFEPMRDGKGAEEPAKYINSPETPLFAKSKILYGFDTAKHSIRKHDFSIVVEGQMDLLMSHQAGYTNTVALSGTALSAEQVTQLMRLSRNTVFAFDADRAGILSSGRSAELALSMGMNVKVASLPKGVDPADLVKEAPLKWKEVIRQSKHIIDFYLDVIEGEERDLRTFRLKVQETVLPFVARIGNKIDQAHFVASIASRLNLSENPIWEELEKIPAKGESVAKVPEQKPFLSRRDLIGRKLIGILLWQEGLEKPSIEVEKLRGELTALAGAMVGSISQDMKQELIFEAEVAYERTSGVDDIDKEISELLNEFKREELLARRNAVTEALKRAEKAGNAAEQRKLEEEHRRLSTDLLGLSVRK